MGALVAIFLFIPGIASQGTSTCEAPVDSFRKCMLRDGDWQHRVYVSKEVETSTALALLVAVRDGRLVNRQPAGSSGKVPTLPKIDVGRIFQVRRPWYGDRVAYQYVLMTADPLDSQKGLELWVNLRDGQVEIVGVADWIA
jgi:hypothetical protein